MFEKIFGIFRKRKKTDISQEIPGDLGEDTFAPDSGFEEDFEADTISLETGISADSGFSDSGIASGPGIDEGMQEPGASDLGDLLGEDTAVGAQAPPFEEEGPISPAPEVQAYTPPKRKRGIKGVLVMVAVIVIGLAIGFFGVQTAVQFAQKLLTKGPTPAEQLAAVEAENAQIKNQLTGYRAVGNIQQIVAIREELKKRTDLVGQIQGIDTKIANQPSVEKRIDSLSGQLDATSRQLVIQKGALANVEKALKQVEARNKYLVSATKKNLELTEEARMRSDILKERLSPEEIDQAETAGSLHRSIQKQLQENSSEALSPS